MVTRALAQNLVAIGMADLIQRTYQVATHCQWEPHHGCCQDQYVDVLHIVLEALGASEEVIYAE